MIACSRLRDSRVREITYPLSESLEQARNTNMKWQTCWFIYIVTHLKPRSSDFEHVKLVQALRLTTIVL